MEVVSSGSAGEGTSPRGKRRKVWWADVRGWVAVLSIKEYEDNGLSVGECIGSRLKMAEVVLLNLLLAYPDRRSF